MFNNPFGMVVGIVAVVMIAGIVREYLANQRQHDAGNDILDEVDHRIKALEDRIRNLETILTSKDYDLEREFEKLNRDS